MLTLRSRLFSNCHYSIAGVTACLALVFFLTLSCSKGPEQKAAQPRTAEVSVITVEKKDVPVSVEYVAQTQSSRQVNIQARVSGFLDKRVYQEGAVVKEGQTLFIMDQKPFKVQLQQAEAALNRQKAAKETARANLARVKPLAALNALSKKDLDDATGQYESYEAAVDQAQAQVEQAKLNLSYTVITSPVTGVSSYAQQADGTYINMQNSLLTNVAVLSPMWVNFSISENEQQDLRDQMRKGLLREAPGRNYVVEIILVDGSIFPHTGRITFAESSFNAQTGTFLIRASVDNPQGILKPNQYVRVRLKGAVRPNAILVPQRAIQQSAKGHFVWVVDKEGKAEARPVVVGEWNKDEWFVFEGLRSGERIVVDGALTLGPGMPLTIKEPAKQQGPSSPESSKPETSKPETSKPESSKKDMKKPPAEAGEKKSP
ncbi:MAG: efflux RND transporter periplasmic adaptor subunit [Syntrophaceae bacterium]